MHVSCYVQRLAWRRYRSLRTRSRHSRTAGASLARHYARAMHQAANSDDRPESDRASTGQSDMTPVADVHSEGQRLDPNIYQAIFEHSLDGVMFTAPDGRIFAANDAACALLRMSEDEIIASGREGLMDPTDPVWDDAVDQRRREGQMRAKLRMRRGDGMFFLADITSVGLRSRRRATRVCSSSRPIRSDARLAAPASDD